MKTAKVAIVKGVKKPSEKEIDASVRKAIGLVGGLDDIVKGGDLVLIKPNICFTKPSESGATTDPRICKTIANMVKEKGARPVIAEASLVGTDTEECIKASGYNKLREEGYEVIDLKKMETTKVSVPKGKVIKELILPKIVVDANVIISVPKMKTHDNALVTLSLKNMKGVLSDSYKKKFHNTFGIFQGIADLMTVVRPALAVVDGIVAMEGFGPIDGDPVEMGLIIAGKEPVAVDAVTSAVMGFKPQDDGCISAAAESGIGIADLAKIQVVGESVATVQRKFKRAEESLNEMISSFPEGFRLIVGEKACSGCRQVVLSTLLVLQKRGMLDRAKGWCVITGKIDKLPDVDKEKLLLAGDCTTKFKNQGKFAKGCPIGGCYGVASAILGDKEASQIFDPTYYH